MGKKLLLCATATGYQIHVFAEAARRLGAELTLASDRCHVLEDPWGDRAIAVKFDDIAGALEALRGLEFDGVAAVGDKPAILAGAVADSRGLKFHPEAAARACTDKSIARGLYRGAGMRVPESFAFDLPWTGGACPVSFPCVVKPLASSASRGVIRANDEAEFLAAVRRIGKMGETRAQVESYIPGREFAIEGLVTEGGLRAIAIFDKPDPLEGPYFEETIYVTPSRESSEVQRTLIETASAAVKAVGLRHGPAHLELRHNQDGAWILETHARPIGGLCAKTLRFSGAPYEEVLIRHALGEDVGEIQLDGPASGVIMIPIPRGGIYRRVDGVERARAVECVENVVITASEGQRLVPLPEGSSYLGFVFARGATPDVVERALRASHAELRFEIAEELVVTG